jgi:hypothetical protein
MLTYEQDEFFRAVSDVETILENVNIDDLAFQLVKRVPELADKLAFSLDCHLMESDWNTK